MYDLYSQNFALFNIVLNDRRKVGIYCFAFSLPFRFMEGPASSYCSANDVEVFARMSFKELSKFICKDVHKN